MVAACMSADALRIFQLRSQLAHVSAKEQQLAKIADLQVVALQDTLDNVATLEGHNLQLKQRLLASLRTLKAKIGSDIAQKATCANVTGKLDLPLILQNTSKALDFLKEHALIEAHPEPCLSSPTFPPLLQVSWPSSMLEREQGSDQAAETQTAESKARGSSDTVEWPENATTVLIRNIPPRSTIDELLKAFPPDGSYDLMNLPFNIKARRTSSFATINFVSVNLAQAFFERFDGQRLPHSTRTCKSPLRVGPANIQGLEANLLFLGGERRFRDEEPCAAAATLSLQRRCRAPEGRRSALRQAARRTWPATPSRFPHGAQLVEHRLSSGLQGVHLKLRK